MTKRKASIPPLTAEEEARIQAQIANDPDAPELTDEQALTARPFAEAFPDLHAAWKRRPGRPKAEVTKVPVKLRLDPDVVEGYRATGPGWQTRMNDVLRQGLSSEAPVIGGSCVRGVALAPISGRVSGISLHGLPGGFSGLFLGEPVSPRPATGGTTKKSKAERA